MARKAAEVVSEIRKVFTINTLDPNLVRILVGAGRAVITGEIQRLPGYESPIRARTLTKLEVDVADIREISFVRWNLANWSNEAGQWRPVQREQQAF